MAAGNRSPLGFGSILLFHLCVLGVGVFLQNFHRSYGGMVYAALFLVVIVGAIFGYRNRRFLWDVFRSFKSAGVLISLLVVSCVLGTMFIQDLDLRRNGTFTKGNENLRKGELPAFDPDNQITRFALAETHGLLWIFPNEERSRLLEQKVRLSPREQQRVALREKAFGTRAANSLSEGLLASKRKQVEDLTTSNYARKHFEGFVNFYNVCDLLRLLDIFEAWWFYMLLGLIAVNVIVGTMVRAPWSVRDMGVAITHSGILIVLAGALLDVVTAEEGYIHYVYGGRPSDQIESKIRDDKNQTYTHLPFRVRLDRFATEYFHELQVERFDWSRRHDGSPWGDARGHGTPFAAWNQYVVRQGVPRVFEGGKIKLKVLEYKPRVYVTSEIVDDPGGEFNPAIELGVYREPGGGENLLRKALNEEPVLFAGDRRRSAHDFGEFRIEYVWAENESDYRRLAGEAPLPDNGTLILRRGDERVRVPIRLGRKTQLSLGENALTLEFVRIRSALADQKNVNLDTRMQTSVEPILYLKVDGKQISVPRDDREFMSDFGILPGVDLRFDWPDPRDRGAVSIYRVVAAEGRPVLLVQADDDDKAVVEPLRRGARVPLTGFLGTLFLGLEKHVRSAKAQRTITEVSDEEFLAKGGGQKDRMLAAWARVEITGPEGWGTVTREMTPFDRPIQYGDDGRGRPLYAFSLVRTKMARDWFSVLSVLDHDDDVVKTHRVQVNDPLRYNGYRFFQANAGETREGLGVSGISVTANPGVNFMYWGYSVLTLGVCWIFFVKPIIDRRRRARRRQEAA